MPFRVLKDVFGFDSFRPGQEEVIKAVLDGRDTLAVMPTGGGKSLCYQVPALMQQSLTVIVSPLISLMKDQVDSLVQSQVASAAALHSGLSPEERWDVERRVRSGEVKMLYVAPERLRSLEFVLSLRRAGVGLFVVDEAHCVSEWGHDFRPDYLFLPRVVRDLGGPPVLALTATATPRVRGDIARSMRMRDPAVIVTSFNRPNLTYRVVEARSKKEKLPLVLEQIRRLGSPGIVYALSRKDCEEMAQSLRDSGVDAVAYHAGLGAGERSRIQERFMTDEVEVVVATIAFGMGVDKPNVRFVIHASAPGSLPEYIQESGRAGRDGEPSECIVLYRSADVGRRKGFIIRGSSSEDDAADFFGRISTLGGERVNVPPASLASLAGSDGDPAGILLRDLEDAGALTRSYDLWENVEVRGLQEEPGDLADEVLSVHSALPGAGEVGLLDLARKAGVRPAVAEGAVYSMMADGVLEAVPRGALVDVRLRESDLGPALRHNLASRLKARTSASYDQLRDVENYAGLSSCRRERLLRHFGDVEEVAPCGGCDVCLGEVRESVVNSVSKADETPRPEVDQSLFERLKEWRLEQARSQGVPAYVVLHNSHLEEISSRKPRTVRELGEIKGIGLRRAARYGEAVTSLVNGDAPSPEPPERNGDHPEKTPDLEEARELLLSGRGSEAVPLLARALREGDEATRREIDELLAPTTATIAGPPPTPERGEEG